MASVATSTRTSATKPRFRRAESLRNEHVMFADEISADDEKFSPKVEVKLSEFRKRNQEDY